jgi:Flp pilus assembly protein TadG
MSRNRRQSGITLVEFGAAASLYLPLLFAVIFVIMEASAAYIIKTNIDQAAKQAGRSMAHAYGMDPTIATDSTKQQAIYTAVRIPNYVADNNQFTNPVFDFSTNPATVTVTCTYPNSGAFGLPPFPNPDPLRLGPTFIINSSATYSLE